MSELPGLIDAQPLIIGVVVGVMIVAGLVHGTLGLGFPMVATPLLSLMTDVRSAILITLLPTVAVNVLSILKGGRWNRSVRQFWPLMAFVICGSVAGSWVLSVTDPGPFRLVLAFSIVLYLSVNRFGGLKLSWITRYRRGSLIGFGFVAGFLAGTVNVMVPVLIIYTLEMSLAPVVMVQVFNLCFVTGKVSQMGIFWNQGLFNADVAVATLPLALIAAVALALGMIVRERVAAETYRRWLRKTLWVMAALLVAQFAILP